MKTLVYAAAALAISATSAAFAQSAEPHSHGSEHIKSEQEKVSRDQARPMNGPMPTSADRNSPHKDRAVAPEAASSGERVWTDDENEG